ncbi:MAG: 50S ribosomal protein L18e [Aeropyrum sp.]|nr:50S ribosomal protein L18e [Aeropyrum sp.]MCE4615538.1 50S ribosomal protein L18e [Aeropyrum sp.]
MRRTGPTNIIARKLITALRKASKEHNAPVWDRVAEVLERPTRRRPAVNVSKINRYAREGEMVIVPGKVLGAGVLDKRVTVAALSFSMQALVKIKLAGGRAVTLEEALRENPRGTNTRIII